MSNVYNEQKLNAILINLNIRNYENKRGERYLNGSFKSQ